MNKNQIQRWKTETGFNDKDIKDIEDSFSGDLTFGTSGLRGLMGIGTNRMNDYVVERVTKGLAEKVLREGENCVALTYDSRINSEKFAKRAAEVFCACGLKVYITKTLSATPFLSFAVQELKCGAGVNVTASHNKKEYNGYKVYDSRGLQIGGSYAKAVSKNISKYDYFGIEKSNFDDEIKKGNIKYIEESLYKKYINNVKKQNYKSCKGVKVCYTPLNGGGGFFVPPLLKELGAEVVTVCEQIDPNGNFETCPYPNPEMPQAYNLAQKYAEKNKCDIIIANDPDTDRIGAMYFNGKGYSLLSGNEIGLIVCSYLLEQKSKKEDLSQSVIVRTVVTMRLIDKIAADYGVKIKETLTGFKNICLEAVKLAESGNGDKFIAGYEESNGIAVGTYAFDKDGICAAMLLCEIAAMLKNEGINYGGYLERLYKKYGIIKSRQKRINTKSEKKDKTNAVMTAFRKVKYYDKGLKLCNIKDYLYDEKMPYNLIVFEFENGNNIYVRPSGTEPLIKIYMNATGDTYLNNFKLLEEFVSNIIDSIS